MWKSVKDEKLFAIASCNSVTGSQAKPTHSIFVSALLVKGPTVPGTLYRSSFSLPPYSTLVLQGRDPAAFPQAFGRLCAGAAWGRTTGQTLPLHPTAAFLSAHRHRAPRALSFEEKPCFSTSCCWSLMCFSPSSQAQPVGRLWAPSHRQGLGGELPCSALLGTGFLCREEACSPQRYFWGWHFLLRDSGSTLEISATDNCNTFIRKKLCCDLVPSLPAPSLGNLCKPYSWHCLWETSSLCAIMVCFIRTMRMIYGEFCAVWS